MDFATVFSPLGVLDWAIANGDLASDGGLDTAVAISLLTDRLANDDDVLPDNSGDRRGWWGDAYLPPLADGTPDHMGSRFWVHLTRALATPETALFAQGDAQEALAWIEQDGIGTVTVPLPTYPAPGFIKIRAIIAQQTSSGVINTTYETVWNMNAGIPSSFAVIPNL
jgi:phage gp46-like protein